MIIYVKTAHLGLIIGISHMFAAIYRGAHPAVEAERTAWGVASKLHDPCRMRLSVPSTPDTGKRRQHNTQHTTAPMASRLHVPLVMCVLRGGRGGGALGSRYEAGPAPHKSHQQRLTRHLHRRHHRRLHRRHHLWRKPRCPMNDY